MLNPIHISAPRVYGHTSKEQQVVILSSSPLLRRGKGFEESKTYREDMIYLLMSWLACFSPANLDYSCYVPAPEELTSSEDILLGFPLISISKT